MHRVCNGQRTTQVVGTKQPDLPYVLTIARDQHILGMEGKEAYFGMQPEDTLEQVMMTLLMMLILSCGKRYTKCLRPFIIFTRLQVPWSHYLALRKRLVSAARRPIEASTNSYSTQQI